MNVSMYVCMYVRMYVCMYVRMYVRMYVCMFVCLSVCVCARTACDKMMEVWLEEASLVKKARNGVRERRELDYEISVACLWTGRLMLMFRQHCWVFDDDRR